MDLCPSSRLRFFSFPVVANLIQFRATVFYNWNKKLTEGFVMENTGLWLQLTIIYITNWSDDYLLIYLVNNYEKHPSWVSEAHGCVITHWVLLDEQSKTVQQSLMTKKAPNPHMKSWNQRMFNNFAWKKRKRKVMKSM